MQLCPDVNPIMTTSCSFLLLRTQGYDTTAHALACFGGAGGQHACAIARTLGMKEIFVHRCVRGAIS